MSARVRWLVLAALVAGALAGPGAGAAMADFSFTLQSPVEEGGTAAVTVTRSGLALLDPATVTVTTGDPGDTAAAGPDYTAPVAPSNTLSWNELETGSKTLQIPIANDPLDENAETFTVKIASSEAITGPASRQATISADSNDLPPIISIGNASITEGTGTSSTILGFPVTLSGPSGKTITANLATADGTATAGQDYTAKASPPPLSIPAGATTSTIHVALTADNVDEPDETLTMTLSALANTTAGTLTATGTILNDDVPTVSIGNVSITETNANQTVGFPVTLSNPSTRTITVAFATVDDSAKAGSDYTANNGTVTFAPGETAQTIAIEILGDTLTEKAEAFGVVLSASNGTATGIGRITDDDVPAATGTPAAGNDVGFGAGVLPGAGADTTPPAIKVSRPTLARSGVLKLTVACQAGEKVCRGTVTVFSRPAPKSKVKALRGEVKIGKTNFVIPGGKEARLTLRLSKRVLGLLLRARTVRVTAFVVGRDAAGNIGTTQKPGTLRRPRR